MAQIQVDDIENQSSQKAVESKTNGNLKQGLPAEIVNKISETTIQLNSIRKELKKNKNAFINYATEHVLFSKIISISK